MDTRAADREVIEKVLADYAAVPYAHGNVVTQTVFDRASDHYLLMIVGSDNRRRRGPAMGLGPRLLVGELARPLPS
jgi:hypothetical protein